MFDKVKKAENKKQLMDLLTFIVSGTQGASGRVLVPNILALEIIKYEPTYIKTQGDPDPAGNITAFATSLGIAAVTGKAPAEVGAVAATFTLEEGIAIPESKRGGGVKAETYPFASMAVGQSFFVAATEEKPNPAKSLASTVSSANKRFAVKHPKTGEATGKDGRTFTVRARTVEDKETSNGARVWRVS